MADKGTGRGAMRRTAKLAWHHTVTTIPPTATEAAELAHIKDIETYHLARGFGLFGYHGVAFPSGRAYLTGDLQGVRAHIRLLNDQYVGFALVGDFSTTSPQSAQLRAAAELRRLYIEQGFPVPVQEAGHTDYALPASPTSCPGNQRSSWIPKIGQEETDMLKDERDELMRIGQAVDAIRGREDNHILAMHFRAAEAAHAASAAVYGAEAAKQSAAAPSAPTRPGPQPQP